MGALLSDVKISRLTLQCLLKYDELKWEMGLKRGRKDGGFRVISEGGENRKCILSRHHSHFQTRAMPLKMH